jgi:hypothetical protein
MCTRPAQEYPWRGPKSQPQEIVSVGYREEASNYSALSIGYDRKGTAYVLWRRTEPPESVIDRVVKDAEGFFYTCQFQCDDARCADSTFLSLIRGET